MSSDPLSGLRPVFDVVKKINSELDLPKLLELILETTLGLCNASRGMIVTFRKDGERSRLMRDRSGRRLEWNEMPLATPVLARVRENGQVVLSADARNDGKIGTATGLSKTGPLSVLCIPLRVKEKLTGAVYLEHAGAVSAFGPREVEIAGVLTDHAALAIHNTMLYRKSIRDRLTKVGTHAYFEKRLAETVLGAKKRGLQVGLLMIDVDDFKSVNDTHGHDTGNAVLKHVAATLQSTVRMADVVGRGQSPLVARYGGDEFEVILPGTGREGTLRVGERLVHALGDKKLAHGGQKLRLSISVGGAVYPADAATAHDLQLRADEALYDSKRGGKNRALLCKAR